MKRFIIRSNSIAGYITRIISRFTTRFTRIIPRFILVLLLLVIFLQIFSFVLGGLLSPPVVAEWGAVEHGRWMNTYVFRDEEIVYPPFSGEVRLLVTNGIKVREGEPLAEVVTPAFAAQLSGDWRKILRAIDRRLYSIEKEIKQLDKDIDFHSRQLAKLPSGPARDSVLKTLNQVKVNKKYLLSAKEEVLQEGKTKIAPKWQEHYRIIRAEVPGVFLTGLDGGEFIGLEALQEEKKLFSGELKVVNNTSDNKGNNGSSKPIGKIVMGAKLTLVFQVPKEIESFTPEAGAKSVVYMENKEFPVTFMGTSFNQSTLFWIFEENTFSPEFLQKRVSKSYLIYKNTSGVRVPRSSLVYKEEDGWYLLTATGRKLKDTIRVTLIDENEDWAIIQGVTVGTPLSTRVRL